VLIFLTKKFHLNLDVTKRNGTNDRINNILDTAFYIQQIVQVFV